MSGMVNISNTFFDVDHFVSFSSLASSLGRLLTVHSERDLFLVAPRAHARWLLEIPLVLVHRVLRSNLHQCLRLRD